jgi:hypothetical protein
MIHCLGARAALQYGCVSFHSKDRRSCHAVMQTAKCAPPNVGARRENPHEQHMGAINVAKTKN